MADRRQAATTAGAGYALVGVGGAVRGRSIDDAHHALGLPKGDRLMPSSLAVYGVHRRRPGHVPLSPQGNEVKGTVIAGAKKITRKFALGTGLATLGAPAAGLGTYELLKHRRDQVAKSSTAMAGVEGVGEAWKQKGQSIKSGAPARARLVPIGLGTAGGALGALATHRGLDKAGKLIGREITGGHRSALTAMAAVPGTLATIPASRRLTRRFGYTVTPTGTHKIEKSLKVLPWDGPRYAIHNTRGRVRIHEYHGENRFTIDHGGNHVLVGRSTLTFLPERKVAKAATDYRGRHVSYGQQRVRIMAAGSTPGPPGLGAAMGASTAARLAPPGQQNRAAARQLAGGVVAGNVAGVLAAHKAAQVAERSPRVHAALEKTLGTADRKFKSVTPEGLHRFSPIKGDLAKPKVAGAIAGYIAGHAIAGNVGTQVAISRNIAAQRKYNRHRHFDAASVNKADNLPMTQTQRKGLVQRKRSGAVLSVAGGSLGLAGLALVGAKRPGLVSRREKLVVGAAGVGGVNAFNTAAINHREAVAERKTITKSSPLQTTMTDDQAHQLVHGKGGYGLTGPLPHGLDRPTKMSAYEARYVASGGRKSQRWQHVKQGADIVRNVGIAGVTLSGAAELASHSGRAKRLIAPMHMLKRYERMNSAAVRSKATRTAVASATLAGAAELTEEGAQRRRGRYSSAPGGVAASALTRMRAYTP